ncbi:BLUF domain-containing protein [Parasalinivibrio latis]
MTENELDELLEEIRTNNERLNVSGMLLYKDGCFIQVIEGPPETLEALFDRISNDDRHHDVMELLHTSIPSREFGAWTMGYQRLGDDQLNGFNNFFCQNHTVTQNAKLGSEALALMLTYR